ncbi:SpoIID/LytB domain-containing protein [Anaerotignum sp.]|uniref:SpoIID/LytB domain-containing protein n=1 Tax=Anaerotignum sp. TaxID=2039241 RepID=UPI0029D4413A|nr:SpoIID/LytB domain-containing protein [Anaerotignum sp.]MCI6056379.1 SpoIID/LytB domain-containing protein [Clostridia bacterium]MDY3595428.1 SpoIID/LytB domain-containing protein [Anaerotignum sp.]
MIKWKQCMFGAVLAGAVCMNMPQAAFAYDVPEMIEVGLESVCKNATSASIGSSQLAVGTLKNDKFREDGTISSSGGFTAKMVRGEVIRITDSMSQKEAEDLAYSLRRTGFDAACGYLGNDEWTVYVQNSSRSEVESASKKSAERISSFNGICLSGGGENLLMVSNDVDYGFSGTDDTFTINGKQYRGCLRFAVNGTVMTAVNVVDLEEYLYGVIPAEMPASYGEEALKAQTLAARTYAMTKLNAHKSSGYELCDTINCQVYKGYSGENSKTNAIVDETEGEIICYNGTPIEAVFSASTGGYTENSENVWNSVVPYLRAVPEVGEYGNNTWTKTLTLSQLDSLLSAKGENIGSAQDIVITKISTGGRVQEMKIVGTSGSVTLTKENIRTYFSGACGSLPSKMFTINGKGGDPSSGSRSVQRQATKSSSTGSLTSSAAANGITAKTEGTLSAMNGKNLKLDGLSVSENTNSNQNTPVISTGDYQIYDVNISTVENGTFVFEGSGNGHGVGLSQNGAQGMAQQGYSYEEIIKHYYTGVTIEG